MPASSQRRTAARDPGPQRVDQPDQARELEVARLLRRFPRRHHTRNATRRERQDTLSTVRHVDGRGVHRLVPIWSRAAHLDDPLRRALDRYPGLRVVCMEAAGEAVLGFERDVVDCRPARQQRLAMDAALPGECKQRDIRRVAAPAPGTVLAKQVALVAGRGHLEQLVQGRLFNPGRRAGQWSYLTDGLVTGAGNGVPGPVAQEYLPHR